MLRLAPRTAGLVATLCWLVSVATGFAMLSAYASAPGMPARAPHRWPLASTIVRQPGVPTVLVFAHPNCPCTRATIGELDWLLARVHGTADVHVVLWEPAHADRAWAEQDLAQLAAAIPTVRIEWDAGGSEAARFGVATSGQVLMYDTGDRLRFAGGITGARGHAGSNAGRDGLLLQLTRSGADATAAPVFGCGIVSPPTT